MSPIYLVPAGPPGDLSSEDEAHCLLVVVPGAFLTPSAFGSLCEATQVGVLVCALGPCTPCRHPLHRIVGDGCLTSYIPCSTETCYPSHTLWPHGARPTRLAGSSGHTNRTCLVPHSSHGVLRNGSLGRLLPLFTSVSAVCYSKCYKCIIGVFLP